MWRKHPRPDVDVGFIDLRVEHDADDRMFGDFKPKHIAVRARRGERGTALQFGQNERGTARRDARAMIGDLDIGWRKSPPPSHEFAPTPGAHRGGWRGSH